jgi:hypothetical protein
MLNAIKNDGSRNPVAVKGLDDGAARLSQTAEN